LPVRKRRQFVARAHKRRSCPRFSDENIRARRAGGEAVPLRHGWDEVLIVNQSINQSDDDIADNPGQASGPTRHYPPPGRRNAPPDDRLLRVIQYAAASRSITGASGILDRPVSLTRFALLPGRRRW